MKKASIVLLSVLLATSGGVGLLKQTQLNAKQDNQIYDFVNQNGEKIGSWDINDGTMTNIATTANVVISKNEIGADQSIIFSTDVLTNGGKQGLIFGVEDDKNPIQNGYYSFTVSNGIASLDNYMNGLSIGNGNYTKNVIVTNTYNIKLILTSSSRIQGYVNDEVVFDIFDYQYQGGYIGFYNENGIASYTNAKLKIETNPQAVSNISIPELDFIYIPYLYGYDYPLMSDREINITVTPKEGYNVTINGEETLTKKVNFTEDMKVSIIASNENESTEYLINLRKGYNDSVRPLYHKSMEYGFINDPNGLVYDEMTGLYHMFYQYTRTLNSDVKGNKNTAGDGSTNEFYRAWAHSVSKDLINWKDMPVAILPYDGGNIFSGSVIVDKNNDSGLFDDSEIGSSRLVAFYTWYGPNWHHPINMSYSTDWGVTWKNYGTVFDGSNDQFGDYRDPKIIWVDDDTNPNGGIWMMIFGGWTPIHILTSNNLIDWTFNSKVVGFDGKEFDGECPDFVKLPVNGINESKWMLTLAGEYYVICDLVKENNKYYFKAITPKVLLYNNRIIANKTWNKGCTYAGVTFNHEKYQRAIMVSWLVDYMSDYVNDKYWNGFYTLPIELTLEKTNGMYSVKKTPIEEISLLHKEELVNIKNVEINESSENFLKNVNTFTADIDLTVTLKTTKYINLTLLKNNTDYLKITYDVDNALMILNYKSTGINCPWEDMAATGTMKASVLPIYGKINIRALIDKFAFDVFANNGTQAFYSYFWQKGDAKMELSVEGGSAMIDSLTVYEMKGIN